tara:strand:- start:107 stop:262 length:156 start_codon:yes stop_codon:yes gene_type:complete
MEFLKKYAWQFQLLFTIFFLSRFLMAGYQWWHLLGAVIFGTQSLLIYLKKW